MKTKLIIGGIALAMTSMGNAKLPYLDPTHLPTVNSLINALNYGWADPIDAISAQAVQAETHASNAETHANSAETTANTANSKADTAITTANSANTTAQQAATTVASFDTRLTTAESDAITAKKIAASADETAKGATQTAQTASTKVDSYDSRITAAESKATEAKQTADTAKQTADGIKATADAAKAAADRATDAANTATETANTAKVTADTAKASADKVDQFDQRLSTAESNAKDAKNTSDKASTTADKASTAADKATQFVNELDQKYDTKVKDLSTRVDTVAKQGFTIQDRVIYGHKGQSLQDLIAIAQNDPNISPKLDADHPVVIKLAPVIYKVDEKLNIPNGIVIDGEKNTILEISAYGALLISTWFKLMNIAVLYSNPEGAIKFINHEPSLLYLTSVKFKWNEIHGVAPIIQDVTNNDAIESLTIKVFDSDIDNLIAVVDTKSPSNIYTFNSSVFSLIDTQKTHLYISASRGTISGGILNCTGGANYIIRSDMDQNILICA